MRKWIFERRRRRRTAGRAYCLPNVTVAETAPDGRRSAEQSAVFLPAAKHSGKWVMILLGLIRQKENSETGENW